MLKGFRVMIASVAGLVLAVAISFTAEAEEFYKGKTLTFIVGSSPGGGFDTYTRTIARHIGKHIPGNPRTLVQNMVGAGSLVAANYMYNKAERNGLTVGLWAGSFVLAQRLGQRGIQFDAKNFEWLGVPVRDSPVCALSKAKGITSLKDWLAIKSPVKIGGTGPGSTPSIPPRILKVALGLPIRMIDAYKGTSAIRLATAKGEIDGGCWNWESVKVTWRTALESGDVKVILQINPQRHPELPDVPNAMEIAKDDHARQLIQVGVHDQAGIFRAYSIPPSTPKARVKILQDAFMDTMQDPGFLADAKKIKLDIVPSSGEKVKQVVAGILKTDEAILGELKSILFE